MEIADVRRRVLETITRARRAAADRRARGDEASRHYTRFLDRVAVPLFRQVAMALKAEKYAFTVFTPSGSMRLMSDKGADDYIEIYLDTTGDRPAVVGHSSRSRGGRVIETEHPIAEGPVDQLGEEDVLQFLMRELEPLVER